MLTACGGDRLDRRGIAHTNGVGMRYPPPIQRIPSTCCKHAAVAKLHMFWQRAASRNWHHWLWLQSGSLGFGTSPDPDSRDSESETYPLIALKPAAGVFAVSPGISGHWFRFSVFLKPGSGRTRCVAGRPRLLAPLP
ncbi:hypothetical protein RF55_21769 [Lasius niger]|uniref:Uncharacterized protein n=1 Tax=Lasius niger TaxID=67767 RepID=A0A0J7JX89_LASNI|nr:hypothetical protein RF55_21769 [Lasius niger]